MLKQLILLIFFFICLGGFSQKEKAIVTVQQKQVQQKLTFHPKTNIDLGNLKQNENATVSNNVKLDGFEEIGYTNYDQQSYGSVDNRFCTFPNGTMAAVYNFGPENEQPEFEGRGTGYNYFDGSSWGEWLLSELNRKEVVGQQLLLMVNQVKLWFPIWKEQFQEMWA